MLGKMTTAAVCALAAVMLGGCAGRDAQPVSISRAGDEQLSCAQIDGELNEMLPRVKKLSNDADKLGRNAGVAAVGAILFWPALFALDLSDAEKVEIQAFVGRYQVLSGHRKRLSCPGSIPVLVDSDGKPLAAAS